MNYPQRETAAAPGPSSPTGQLRRKLLTMTGLLATGYQDYGFTPSRQPELTHPVATLEDVNRRLVRWLSRERWSDELSGR